MSENIQYPLGHIESPVDLRDYTYDMIAGASVAEVPYEFEITYQLKPKNQGSIGACVAHSVSSTKEIIDNAQEYYSQWWMYALRNDTDYQGKGMIIRQALEHLTKDGIVSLKSFNVAEEYSEIRTILESKYNKVALLNEANNHKSTGYIRLSVSEIKKYLYNEKKPIILAVNVYDSFYQAPNNGGVIPSEGTGNYCGSHAMVIVGFKGNIVKILNSWGEWGGQGGYLYLDLNSPIITELWGLTDTPIKKNPTKKYRVGWDKDSSTGKWIYSEDGNNLIKDGWKQIKSKWYYFKDIYALDGDWIQYKDKWYYLENNTCEMAFDKWILWQGKWYRFDINGAMVTGWYQDSNNKWYYLDIAKGYCYVNCTILVNGKYITFDSNGVALNK